MSATGRGAQRRDGDRYMTPDPLAEAICRHLKRLIGPMARRWIWEPSAGDGAFVRAAARVWPKARILANDPTPSPDPAAWARAEMTAHVTMEEAALSGAWVRREPRLIVGNPPFSMAIEHVAVGLSQLRPGGTLAFLMRLNLLGSFARLNFWSTYQPAWVVPIVPRPSFTGGGSDATEYGLFVWRKLSSGPTVLNRPLVWREP